MDWMFLVWIVLSVACVGLLWMENCKMAVTSQRTLDLATEAVDALEEARRQHQATIRQAQELIEEHRRLSEASWRLLAALDVGEAPEDVAAAREALEALLRQPWPDVYDVFVDGESPESIMEPPTGTAAAVSDAMEAAYVAETEARRKQPDWLTTWFTEAMKAKENATTDNKLDWLYDVLDDALCDGLFEDVDCFLADIPQLYEDPGIDLEIGIGILTICGQARNKLGNYKAAARFLRAKAGSCEAANFAGLVD